MGYRFGVFSQDQATAEAEFWPNLYRVALRVLTWPFVAFLELASIPWRLCKDESDEYLLALPESARRSLNFCLDVVEADYAEDVKLVWSRIVATYEVSVMFFFQVTVYNLVLFIWQKYGFSLLYEGLKRRLEYLICACCSGFYTTESGSVHAYSMTNILSPSFDLPELYQVDSAGFPLMIEDNNDRLSPIEHPYNSHFMVQLARLAYEHPAVVKDVITTKWNLQFNGFAFNECGGAVLSSESEIVLEQLDYRPNTVVYICSNESSIMIAFRGPDVLKFVSWTSDTSFTRFCIEDLCEVQVEVYNSLFNPRENSLYDKIISIISAPRNSAKSIFLTGHSFGGGMASVFANAVSRSNGIHGRVKGMFTFSQPMIGDEKFSANFNAKHSDPLISLRYVNASDIVPKCPIDYGFSHHLSLRLITSFGNIVWESESVKLAQEYEDRFAFFLGTYKILSDVLQGVPVLACGLRCCLIGLPGMYSSLAIEYERSLRRYADYFRNRSSDQDPGLKQF